MANSLLTLNKAYKAKSDQIVRITKEKTLNYCEVTFESYSAKELLQLYQKPRNAKQTLRFKETPAGIEFTPGEYGYVGVVELKNYYDFITDGKGEINDSLFESNVRHYQGEVDVNNLIRDTVEKDFSVDFWWLNNGVTIIASSCTPFPKTLELENIQIVNGLQTSFTVGRYYDRINSRDERSILVKVLVVKEKDKETVDKIIAASNRQNPITPTILRATDDFQRKLELFFRNKGYFYDRRKNYYRNQGKPASKIFSIQQAAQAIEAILNFNPASARSKPTTLIKSDDTYKMIFNENRPLDAYLNCSLLTLILCKISPVLLCSCKMAGVLFSKCKISGFLFPKSL